MNNTLSKIKNPQIFVMFLPGMYGTFITNVLMYHDLLYNEAVSDMEFLPYIDSEVKEKARYNSHNGPYKDMIPGFHGQPDLDQVHRKTNAELKAYFEPMRNIPLGVHRIADYFDLDFEKFINNSLGVDENLADMLVVPASLGINKTTLQVKEITKHLETNLFVTSKITGCKYGIGKTSGGFEVIIQGVSDSSIK